VDSGTVPGSEGETNNRGNRQGSQTIPLPPGKRNGNIPIWRACVIKPPYNFARFFIFLRPILHDFFPVLFALWHKKAPVVGNKGCGCVYMGLVVYLGIWG